MLNYVATSDLVVALLPNGLGKLGVRDLGGAGHDGFKDTEAMNQMRYVRGGHSTVLQEVHWEEIARFIADGEVPVATGKLFPHEQPFWMRWAGSVSWAFWILLPFLLVLLAWLLFQTPPYIMKKFGYDNIYALAALQSLALVAYAWLVVRIFTRF